MTTPPTVDLRHCLTHDNSWLLDCGCIMPGCAESHPGPYPWTHRFHADERADIETGHDVVDRRSAA